MNLPRFDLNELHCFIMLHYFQSKIIFYFVDQIRSKIQIKTILSPDRAIALFIGASLV